VKRKYNLLIGERTAELVKINIGTAFPTDDIRTLEVKGRDLVAGVPKTLELKSDEICEALAEPVNTMVESVKIALESTPPELSADIVDKGIVMTGGGAMLANLDLLLREATGLPVMLAEDPLTAVVLGTGRCLDELELLLITIVRTGWPWDEEGEPNVIHDAVKDGYSTAMVEARNLLGLNLATRITRTEPKT